MPGEITRAYSAPDGPMPLLPPWESNERSLEWLLCNCIQHRWAYHCGYFAGYERSPAETTATGTMYDAWMQGWREGKTEREVDSN